MVEKIEPNDKRVTTERVKVPTSGHTYTYLLAKPEDQNTIGTAVLLHGFPDLAFGWRNQILFLRDLGYKVVVPNMLGYAGTDAPTDPKEYTVSWSRMTNHHSVRYTFFRIRVDSA